MPGFLEDTGYGDTTTIPLRAGYWVRVKNCLDRAEIKTAEKALTSNTTVDGDSGATTVKPNLAAYRDAMVTASIVEWNLTESDGTPWALAPAAVKRTNVDRIPGPLYDLIWQKVNELNRAAPAEEQAQFRDGRDDGASARDAGAAPVAAAPLGDGAVAPLRDAPVGPGFASVA